MRMSNEDTICAIATPPGFGGIGVVRLSGPGALAILSGLWMGNPDPSKFEARKLYTGELATCDGGVIDRVMATFMPAPHTYTGQDVVEFSCHGSPVVLRKILDACTKGGARIAGPGEFTRRAFLAGKMDLAQAEAVGDLIHATGERAARCAAEQLSGRLSAEVVSIGDELAGLRSFVEASIDFPEEDIELIQKEGIASSLESIVKKTGVLSATFREGRLVREGIRTAIVGRPNVGKSSLLNRLVGAERAIVHHVPGTTRDMVEEDANLGGLVFHLRDTAGLCDSKCEVEELGVARTRDEIAKADLVIAVFDGSVSATNEDRSIVRDIDPSKLVIVINKSDLPRIFNSADVDVPPGAGEVFLSARTGEGIDLLRSRLGSFAELDTGLGEGAIVMSSRHREALDVTANHLRKAENAIAGKKPIECIAEHLRQAGESLGTITGVVTREDLLDRIFSRFCIGK